jgi:hypothetical protein
MNRIKPILIMGILVLTFYLLFIFNIKWNCIFKEIFNIECPGCGLTRSLKALLRFDYIDSAKYNVLGIPVFAITLIVTGMLIKDFIKKENKTLSNIYKWAKTNYIFISTVLIISMIINNINR